MRENCLKMAQKEQPRYWARIFEESLWALIRGSSVLFSEFIFWWILFRERELYIPQADTKIQNKIIVGKLLKLQALYLLLTLHKSFILKAFTYISTLHSWYYSDCILLVGVYQLMEMLMPISALTIGRSMYGF